MGGKDSDLCLDKFGRTVRHPSENVEGVVGIQTGFSR